MGHRDPQQEITEKLLRFIAPGRDAEAQSLTILKERSLPDRKVYFVLLKNAQDRQQRYVCYVVQDNKGLWQFRGAAGGGISGEVGPVVQAAWANLDGGGIPNDFHAGGYVADHGQHIKRVLLRAHNGTEVEDNVDTDGVVLFLTDQCVELPIEAELYNSEGQLVYKHKVLG